MKKWAQKNKYWLFLLAFMMCVFFYTVLGRPQYISDSMLEPFWSYKAIILNGNKFLIVENFLNIMLFVPIGFISSLALSEKNNKIKILVSSLIGLVFSSTIEICQYFLFRGTAEYDDVFNNTLGALVGSLVLLLFSKICKNKFDINEFSQMVATMFIIVAVIACVTADNSSLNILRQLAFQVSNSKVTHNELKIDGFCFTYGFDLMDKNARSLNAYWDDSDYKILLKSSKSGIVHAMKTSTNIESNAINNYFKSEYEYPKARFRARIDIDKLDLNEEYEVMIRSGRLTLSGETFIKGGKIEKTPENENIKLSVFGTDLQKIVENGYLKTHNDDDSCVVYQYGKNLFWILDDNNLHDANNKTTIEYQIWTTQREKLSSYNQDGDSYYYDEEFVFEDHEITSQMNSGKYRVAYMEIPTDFAIAFIRTGMYKDGSWEWNRYFRPRY